MALNFMTAEVTIKMTLVEKDRIRVEKLALKSVKKIEVAEKQAYAHRDRNRKIFDMAHGRAIEDNKNRAIKAAKASAKATMLAHKRMVAAIKRNYKSMTRIVTGAFKVMSRAAHSAFRTVTRVAKLAAAAIVAVGVASIKMAMDAEESENLFEVSMGNMAAATRAWSDDMSDALGLNAFEVRKTVGTFNVMFTSMGLNAKGARDMAQGLTTLTQDMASFFNLKPAEAFQKLQAGITGESEPLKRLGILVNETTTKMFALKNGIGDATGKLTEQEKVLARYGLIMQQTTMAQGDMARTLDSTTNVFRSLWSRIQEVAIGIGNKLLPAVTKVAIKMRDWLKDNQEEIEEWSKTIIDKIEFVIEKMGDLWAVFRDEGFREGFGVIKKELLLLATPLIDTFMILGIQAAKSFWDGFTNRIDFFGKNRVNIKAKYKALGGEGQILGGGMVAPVWVPKDEVLWEKAALQVTSERVRELTKEASVLELITMAWKGIGTAMAKAIPNDTSLFLRKPDPVHAFIGGPTVSPRQGQENQRLADQLVKQKSMMDTHLENMQRSIMAGEGDTLAAMEFRHVEEAKFAEESLELAKKLVIDQKALAKNHINFVRQQNWLTLEEKISAIDNEMARKREAWSEESDAMEALNDERQSYMDLRISGWEALRRTVSTYFNDAMNWGKNLGDVLTSSFDRAADSFADMLMQQKVDWKAFGAMFIKELLSMIMKLYIAVALKSILGGVGGSASQAGNVGISGSSFANPQAVFGAPALSTGFASGGHVLETGIAKVHKGENILPEGSGGTTVNVINNAQVSVDVEENPDERTVNVVINALTGDGPLRRAVNSVRG